MKWLIRIALAMVLIIAVVAGVVIAVFKWGSPFVPLADHFRPHELLSTLEYPSLDTEKVRIPFGSKTYEIPRNYLINWKRPGLIDGEGGYVEIRVLLPGLLPRTAAVADKFLPPGARMGHQDELHVHLYGSVVASGQEEQLDAILNSARKGKNDFQTIDAGYRLYDIADYDNTRNLFAKDTPNGLLTFTCAKINEAKFPGCRITETTGQPYGSLVLTFDRKYLYQAAEISRNFRLLLDSFERK